MAAPSTPAAIPQSSSTTPSPPASASPPSSNTNPPPKPATASPVPSPPPPPAATPPPTPSVVPPPPGSSSPPPNLHPPKPSLPPPTVPPTVPPPQPSPPPPHPSPSPPTVAPPQPSPPSPTVPPPKSSPPPSTVPPPKPSPPPSTVPPPKPSPPPSTIPPPKPSPPPSTVPPPKPSPPTPKPSPPAQAPPPKVESPPPPDAKPPPSSTPPPTNPAEPSPSTYPTPAAANPDNSSKSIKTSSIVGITVGIAALVILMLLAALMIRFTKRRKKSQHVMPSSVKPPESYISQISGPTTSSASPVKTSSSSHELQYSSKGSGLSNSKPSFSYKELSAITNGFSPQNLLGKGGFGDVYKGRLVDGRDVAVKQLKVGGGQGEREFQAEVEIISRIHHRHLVSLVGYCTSENQRLLVFDYVPNNTLHYHLHGQLSPYAILFKEQGRPVMEWATRVRVAAGAARGIAYLHEDCHPRIIHRDIKSSNILLDDNFDAQVSDFGLAKFTVDAQTHVSTRVVGTFGYLAPEYAASGKLTDKSDVFSFGVVLLELVTGRKPVDASQPIGDESLVEWARPLMSSALESGDLGGLPDPKLAGNYDRDEMLRMIETAAVCVRHSALMRPRMAQVMRVLDDLTENKLDLQMGMRPGQSELFNSGPDSADVQLFHRMAFGGPDFSINFSEATRSSDQDL